jgi:hypothetical protein
MAAGVVSRMVAPLPFGGVITDPATYQPRGSLAPGTLTFRRYVPGGSSIAKAPEGVVLPEPPRQYGPSGPLGSVGQALTKAPAGICSRRGSLRTAEAEPREECGHGKGDDD